jgi:hypothetical protein
MAGYILYITYGTGRAEVRKVPYGVERAQILLKVKARQAGRYGETGGAIYPLPLVQSTSTLSAFCLSSARHRFMLGIQDRLPLLNR